MADLFSLTAPLMIRHPGGERHVMAEVFRHPEGLLYFELFWDRMPLEQAVHVVEGEIRGEGPWKVGDSVITLLGCQGSNPEQATQFAEWQLYLDQRGGRLPSRFRIETIARDFGALVSP